MTKLVLVALLGLASLNLARAAEYLTADVRPLEYFGVDLSIKEMNDARKLAEYYGDLDKALREKVPDDGDYVACGVNIEAARELLGKLSLGSLISGRKEAYKLFVSLEDTLGKCDLDSYKILAKNYEAICTNDRRHVERQRVADVLMGYIMDHVKECGPKYRQMYRNLIGKMDKDQLAKLKIAFGGLTVFRFGYVRIAYGEPRKERSIVSIPTPRFSTRESDEEALLDIATEIRVRVDQSEWANSRKAVKNYLFKPCEAYRKLLNGVLSSARFDAKFNNEFLEDDWEFTDALFYNRMCGSLLDDKGESMRLLTQFMEAHFDSLESLSRIYKIKAMKRNN